MVFNTGAALLDAIVLAVVYDMECAGRNRRYYKTTERGRLQLNLYESEWRKYSAKINSIFEGGMEK